jgi:signal transduction histidine kinase
MRLLSLEDLGLAGSLELLLEQEKASAGWEDTDFIHNITGRRFESALETGAYRVAQEALTNARKHAETTHVRLLLLTEKVPLHNGDNAERLRLEVRDWGRGFVPEDKANQIADEMGHVGLQGIIERVHLLDGTCELRSTPGEGATLFAVFPVLKSSPMEQTKTQGEDT